MRVKKIGEEVKVNTISGTNVVFIAMDMPEEKTTDLMGFAIRREDKTDNYTCWLLGDKTFAQDNAGTGQTNYSSLENPFQGFQWADYTAKPGHEYVYQVFPMRGVPGNLKQGIPTEVTIQAQQIGNKPVSVYFNRGAIASQAYTKKFHNVDPKVAGKEALDWLARDLLPGLSSFITRAKDSSYSLHCAFYEFQMTEIIQMLSVAATQRNVHVEVIYGGTPGDETFQANKDSIDICGIGINCHQRVHTTIMHNKFIVLSQNDKPIAVLTGSMNATESAVYGQLNVFNILENPDIAAEYLTYWEDLLILDKVHKDTTDWIETNNPFPVPKPLQTQTTIFSPHKGMKVFDWFKEVASSSDKALFMTFPFGIVKGFRPVFNQNDDVLRFALLEKYSNGGTAASLAAAREEIIQIRKLPNICMAIGSQIKIDSVDGWMKEMIPLGKYVHWVHTKFMLVDPLGDNPTTITSSANWSEPSTNENDENTLVILNDKDATDIYFTEFMRIFTHHRFRESLMRHFEENGTTSDWKPNILIEDPSDWVKEHYRKGSEKYLKRLYFTQ